MTNEVRKYIIVSEAFFFNSDKVVSLAPTVLQKILENLANDTSVIYYISGPQCGEYREKLGNRFLESDIHNVIPVTGTYSSEEEAKASIKESGFTKIGFMHYTKKRVMEIPQKRYHA